MTPISFEVFDWKGLQPGDEVEVLDSGLVIAQGKIESLSREKGILRLKLSYGRGRPMFYQEDGWQVRTVRRAP